MVRSPRRLRPVPAIRDDARSVPSTSASEPAREGPSDEELMVGLAVGDIAALEQLYDRYSALVFSVSLRVLYDRQLAEDVTQEVFLRLWRRPDSYDPSRGRLLSWLMSVTRNRAIDEHRRLARRMRTEEQGDQPAFELRETDGHADPALAASVADLQRAVRAAMATLPPEQRRVIELAYFGGLTQVEIAERTGVPLGTVKTRARLAMRKLRNSLDEYAGEPTP